MVSPARCGLLLSKLLAVALVAVGMVSATIGLSQIQESCRAQNSSSTCASGLQPHWWSLVFQGLILGSMVVLRLCSRLKQWRFVVLTFLVMATARLMWDAGHALEVNPNRTKMIYEANKMHDQVVVEFDKWGQSKPYRKSEWDDDPERERIFWESVALSYRYLAQDTMTRMRVAGDLDAWAVLVYVVGLCLMVVVNVGMLVVYGVEEGECAVVAQEKVVGDKVHSRDKETDDRAYSPPEEPFTSLIAADGHRASSSS